MKKFKPGPLKQEDLTKCGGCGKGVMHNGCPIFYRMKISSYWVNAGAVKRQTGLEMMLGGAAGLAAVMGTNEDLAKPMGDGIEINACMDCALEMPIAALMDIE